MTGLHRPSRKWTLGPCVAAMLLFATTGSMADGGNRDAHPGAPVYGDGADIPAHDPSVNRPKATGSDEDVNVRQEPSDPDISPGAERDSLVPIPEDDDGMIDPQ